MFEIAADWMAKHWLEVASLAIATAALFYAALAYNMSRNASRMAQASDLTNLRIQAKTCETDAQRSLLSLRSSCQANRSAWDEYERKRIPVLARRPTGIFPDSNQNRQSYELERQGVALLHDACQSLAHVNDMNAAQLELGIQ